MKTVAGFLKLAPQYLLGNRLGQGGMGVVHLGTMVSEAGERRVAIKRIVAKEEADQEATARMIAEARLVFQLTHASICQVLDLAHNQDGTFIVMEFVNGLDLQALLRALRKEGKRLDVPLALYVAAKVAEALDYAHRFADKDGQPLRLVHGDVAPKNILLSRDGEVKLADFGIARAIGMLAPGNKLRGGTPGFIAPEVLAGIGDQRADIFSLGVSLYVALGGSMDVRLDMRALKAERPEISTELCDIVERAVATRPEDRFGTAADLERALAVHLARRFPSVTRSSLVEIVTAYAPTVVPGPGDADPTTTLSSMTPAEVVTSFFEDRGVIPPPAGTQPFQAPRGRWRHLALAGVALAGVVGVIGALSGKGKPPPNATAPERAAVIATAPPPEREEPPTPPVPTPPAPTPSPLPRAPSRATTPPAHAREHRARKEKDASATQMGYLTVNAVPWGAVYVDGRRVADETPIYRVPVVPGKHNVTISNPDGSRSSPPHEVVVASGATRLVSVKW
jgi:serine/threonine protein kinase